MQFWDFYIAPGSNGFRAQSPDAWAACPCHTECCDGIARGSPRSLIFGSASARNTSATRCSTPRFHHEVSLVEYMEFVTPEGLRRDGRRPKELRQLRCEIGVFPHADGSATFNIGNTQVSPFWSQATMSTFPLHGSPMVSAAQVIATVFGPRVADSRGESSTDRAIVKCAYSEAHFAAGALPHPCVNFLFALPSPAYASQMPCIRGQSCCGAGNL